MTNTVADAAAKPADTGVATEDGVVSYCDGAFTKKILVEGKGDVPVAGSEVTVHYVGTLMDGSKFDSSRDRDGYFKFKIGQGKVIKGWDEGVATMVPGEKSVFVIQPHFAYGANGQGKIPPNAVLQFEIELFSWSNAEALTDDHGVLKSTLKKGDDTFDTPNSTTLVMVRWSGVAKEDGRVLVEKTDEPVALQLGDVNCPEGLSIGVASMSQGETASFACTAEYAAPLCDANATFTVELVSYEPVKSEYDMNNAERVAEAVKHKAFGNAHWKAGNMRAAHALWTKTVELVGDVDADDALDAATNAATQVEVKALLASTHGNLAALALKQKEWAETVSQCDSAIANSVDGTPSVKLLYRRAQAHAHNEAPEAAIADCKQALEIDASSKECARLLSAVTKRVAAANARQRKAYAGMFDRVSFVTKEETEAAAAKAAAAAAAASRSQGMGFSDDSVTDESDYEDDVKVVDRPADEDAAVAAKEDAAPPEAAAAAGGD